MVNELAGDEAGDERIRVSMARELLSSVWLAAHAAFMTETDGHAEVSVDPLRDLLAIDHRQALEFFFLGLQDVSEPTVDRQELAESGVDVAIHTHAQTCCRSKFSRATVSDLGDVVHRSWRSSADISRICLEATTAIVPLENGS